MQLSSKRQVPASVEDTFAALTDAAFLKDCIPGCESMEAAGEGRYLVTLAAKVGPVSARFQGSMTIVNPQPPRSYTLLFEGKGGSAGFAKGSADVSLEPGAAGNTEMEYSVQADVGGKIAQIGSRLIESAAKKVADEFFGAFIEKMKALSPQAEAPGAPNGPQAASTTGPVAVGSWKVAVVVVAVIAVCAALAWTLR